jgi:hypothetical protein
MCRILARGERTSYHVTVEIVLKISEFWTKEKQQGERQN